MCLYLSSTQLRQVLLMVDDRPTLFTAALGEGDIA
jgi:hypothetical protein